jgi:hypothetical protein
MQQRRRACFQTEGPPKPMIKKLQRRIDLLEEEANEAAH